MLENSILTKGERTGVCVFSMVWPEDGILCGVGRLDVVHRIDQSRNAKRVREQDELYGGHVTQM